MHSANHGIYKHMCSFCSRQGRNLAHIESKCNFKAKQQDSNSKFEVSLPLGQRDCKLECVNSKSIEDNRNTNVVEHKYPEDG